MLFDNNFDTQDEEYPFSLHSTNYYQDNEPQTGDFWDNWEAQFPERYYQPWTWNR